MPRPRRKKPPKYDYHALNDDAIARPPTEAEAGSPTKAWLKVPGNVDRLLEQVSSGQSLRRFCESESLSYSVVQRFLTSPEMEDRYRTAQSEQAEHLIGEMERITAKIEDGSLDPKAGSVILDNLKWRASKFNLRFSDRQIVEQHVIDHHKMHVEAVRQLARMTTVKQIESATKPALIHHAVSAPHPEPEQVLEGELVPAPDPDPDPSP